MSGAVESETVLTERSAESSDRFLFFKQDRFKVGEVIPSTEARETATNDDDLRCHDCISTFKRR